MKRLLTTTAVTFGLALAIAAPATAQDGGQQVLQANLTQLNDSGASATATVSLNGNEMTVEVDGKGFTPGEAPHAQHIHGVIGESATCPTEAQDTDGDGIVTTSEGAATYGPILVSLTSEGEMTPDDALAVDRMPVSDANGILSYERTFTVDAEVAKNIDSLHIVSHGVDFDGSGAYDGDRKSDLDETLPAEATDPAVCGELVAMPMGGVQTGGGGMAGMNHGGTESSSSNGVSTTSMALIGAAGIAAVTGGRFALRRNAA